MNNSSKSPLLNQLPNKTESGSSFDPLPQSYFKHPEKTHVLPYPQTACSPAKNSQAKRVSDILSGLSYRPTTKIQRQKSPPPALSAQTTEILARVKEKKERENVSTGAVKVASRVQEERVIEQNSNDSSAMSNEEKSSDNPRIHDQSLSEPVAAVTVTPTLTTLIVTDTPMPPVAERIDASTPDKISTTSTPSRGSGRGGRRGRGIRRKISPITPEIIRNEIDTAAGATEMPVRDPLSGRGRGRGSRGFPRKPRGSVALTTPAADRPTARGARGGGIGGSDALKRGAKGSGGKRKRGDDEGDEDAEDTDASETITPLPTQSRSGRKIFKATTFTPVIKIDDEDGDVIDSSSTRVARPIATGNAGNGTTLMPPTAITTVAGQTKNKKRRQTGATAVCKNCGRGPSPASNVIVFCDGCNKPWHQYCHDPPVKGEVLQIEEQEWFCADCAILREDKGILEGRGPARTDMGLGEVCFCLFQFHLQSLFTISRISIEAPVVFLFPWECTD